ncbi:MAG: type VI secretion system-associated FHA domain protein TagH, partial [Caulobacteraceae bacterium]|nr:type VI secretion system-associated FHA domain protein TagH [Caulobacteraceae bacterium]
MTLTLNIINMDQLDNGESTRLVLDRHGAVIGRSPHADWSLPDPRNHVSSIHCEIDYRDGAYLLIDKSTNGTFLNNAQSRMIAPHILADGDEIVVGHYRIEARLAGAAPRPRPAAPSSSGWAGWESDAPAARPDSGWSSPSPAPQAPPQMTPPPPEPASGGWGAPPRQPT